LLWGVDARCDVHGLNFRLDGIISGRVSSRIPGVLSLPSGQDGLVRRLLRWPTGLAIVLVCAVLWHRAMFALTLWWHLSWPRTTLSFAQGTNASGLAVLAVSASPAGLTPAVPSARAGAAPATGNAPPCLCTSMHEGLTFPTSAFSAVHAGPRLSRSLAAMISKEER